MLALERNPMNVNSVEKSTDSTVPQNLMEAFNHREAHKCKLRSEALRCLGYIWRQETTLPGKTCFEYKECGIACRYQSFLSRHKRTRTGEKPCEYMQCDKAHTDPSSLQRHQRAHTGERPCEWKQCGKVYGDPSLKQRPERAHTREKPYEYKKGRKPLLRSHNLLKTHDSAHWRKIIEMCRIWEMLQL